MKVIVQRISGGKYLGPDQVWVESQNKARSFSTSLQAIDFCLKHRIFEVELILCFEEPRYNIRLKVFPRKQNPAMA